MKFILSGGSYGAWEIRLCPFYRQKASNEAQDEAEFSTALDGNRWFFAPGFLP